MKQTRFKCKSCGKEVSQGYFVMYYDYDIKIEYYYCKEKACTDKLHAENARCNIGIFNEDIQFIFGYIDEEDIIIYSEMGNIAKATQKRSDSH